MAQLASHLDQAFAWRRWREGVSFLSCRFITMTLFKYLKLGIYLIKILFCDAQHFIQHTKLNMFSFCCGESKNQEVYQVKNKKASKSQTVTFNEIDDHTAKTFLPHMQILKIKQSQYRELVQQYQARKQLWEDISFPPNSASLGQIPGITDYKWKRLSQIVTDAVLFDGRIEPQDIIQGALGDCYFLSAVAALAERENRILQIFGDQPGSKNAIYKVTLRINGVIEEIVVDDFVPVNRQGEPIFCQPNKNEIWVPLFEKAWAKANGSYANIIAGSPSQIFKAATYAPSEVFATNEEKEGLWKIIYSNAKKQRPCCCGTKQDQDIEWLSLGLVQGHAYSLIDAAELQDIKGNPIRILKLRNPWGNTEWGGQGCESDHKFWSAIPPSEQKGRFLKSKTINNDGIFYILFRDYIKYFNQTHICEMEENGNYVFENFTPHQHKATLWECQILEQDQYTFQLHQQNVRAKQEEESSLCRATILVLRKSNNGFQYVSGVMSHYQEDCSLKVQLLPGKYIIYSKFDPSLITHKSPTTASLSIYSLHYAILQAADRLKYPNILRECFLQFAKANKRKTYQNNSLWISYKLMFKGGGMAFIAFGAQKDSRIKWEVNFKESNFTNNGFKLKRPFKGKGEDQRFQVLPGKAEIILVRVKNENLTNLKFPPQISWKMVPLT